MKPLILDNNVIDYHEYFTFTEGKNKGKRLKLTGTESTGFKCIDAIDTIKNVDNGKYTELTREKLKSLNPVIITK